MGDKFENAVAAEKKSKGADFDSSFTEMISLRRLNTDTLFYRFLEKIAISEGERTHSSDRCDLSVSLVFKLLFFACRFHAMDSLNGLMAHCSEYCFQVQKPNICN